MLPNNITAIEDLSRMFPLSDSSELRSQIREELEKQNIRIAVLDDDPTGVQTIHDCRLYTSWENDDLADGMTSESRMFYVLTNSRSLGPLKTTSVYRTIGKRLRTLADDLGVKLIAISRSDSTLRGHFAEEVRAMRESLLPSRVHMPVPFLQVMFEAGRYTYHGEHLVDTGASLVKAEATEFARDREFGYSSSHLPTYVRSKLGATEEELDIATYDIETQRAANVEGVTDLILQRMSADYLCPDALSYLDLEKFALAMLRVFAAQECRTWVCRSSSSFPRALCGQEPIELLRGPDLIDPVDKSGGIVFVGSHVKKTSLQLEHLLSQPYAEGIEVSTEAIHHGTFDMDSRITRIDDAMASGRTPVVYTSRDGVFLDDAEENLKLSRLISSRIVELFKGVRRSPAFVVSKGGITSHDLLTRGAGVRKALVKGAILPGVPVLWVGPSQNTPFVIFPGNVGAEESVTEAVDLLRGYHRPATTSGSDPQLS
jgi:uncharacterized protein YgbK (DUF1537 family)